MLEYFLILMNMLNAYRNLPFFSLTANLLLIQSMLLLGFLGLLLGLFLFFFLLLDFLDDQ